MHADRHTETHSLQYSVPLLGQNKNQWICRENQLIYVKVITGQSCYIFWWIFSHMA